MDEEGGTTIVVVATISDAPLEGEFPLIQLVVPEGAANMKGVVLDFSDAVAEVPEGLTKSVVVLLKVDVAVRVMVGSVGSGCWLAVNALAQAMSVMKIELV